MIVTDMPDTDRRSVLMVAFHFPPFKGSSGVERTLGFCRYLPELGWQPIVLSAALRSYPATSSERLGDVPSVAIVERAFALDTTRHLGVGGRYPGWLALPDRWISWVLGAVPRGMALVRRHRPSAIWSTYPIATAHVIACALHRISGLPWIADFRDPMVEFNRRKLVFAPSDPRLRSSRLRVERLCARYATRAVFCTATAARIFTERYPEFPAERAVVIPNGYDERAFADVEGDVPTVVPGAGRRLKLLHSGVLYPGPDRDPTAFLEALKSFLNAHPEWQGRIEVVFRASGFDEVYGPVIRRLGLESVVMLAPMVAYREAVREMLEADGLLVFQGYTSNPAIPAKAYEYLRARRPVLALLDDEGETAGLLRRQGVGTILPIDDAGAIERGLGEFLGAAERGSAPVLSVQEAARLERRSRTDELARLLGEICQSN